MGPAVKLLNVRQGERWIEDYARDFMGVARQSAMENTCLIFWGGLAEPFRSRMLYWVPVESLEDYINLALNLSDSAFRVELAVEPAQFREPTESAQRPLCSVSPQSPLQSPLHSVSPQSPLQSPLHSVSPQSPLQSPLSSVSPQSPHREPRESAKKACEAAAASAHGPPALPAPPWHPCLPLPPGPLPLHGPGQVVLNTARKVYSRKVLLRGLLFY